MNKKFAIQFALGIIVALIVVVIMFDGSIFGENHSSIAVVIGIIGISVIATSNTWNLKK